MPSTAQKPSKDPNTQLKARIIEDVENLVKKDPGQASNAASVKKLIAGGTVPTHKAPMLYAIGGQAGVVSLAKYGEILRKNADVTAKSWRYFAGTQLMAGAKQPPAPSAAPAAHSQFAASASFGRSPNMGYAHEILVEFRCPSYVGGDETKTRMRPTINDTGSNMQNIRRSDWNAMKAPNMAPLPVRIDTANGELWVDNVCLEVRILAREMKKNAQGQKEWTRRYEPLTPWYIESMGIVEDDVPLLSGAVMRDFLYFATAPGNDQLFVSQKKNGVVASLPVGP